MSAPTRSVPQPGLRQLGPRFYLLPAAGASYSDAPSGGLVLGGSISDTRILALAQSAGVVLGGSITDTRVLDLTQSAGLVLGGSAVFGLVRAATPSAGLVLGGSATSDRTVALPPSAGIVLGGSCSISRAVAYTPAGGLVLGGSAATTYTVALPPGAGIILGGTCVSSLSVAGTITSTPSGGVVLGGSVTTAQFLSIFPVSDRSDGGWTDQAGGTNLYAAIDEVAVDDADYIKSITGTTTVDICEVRFAPQLDPASSTNHVLVYRYGSEAEGWTTVTQTLSGAQADAITNYADLSVKFEAVV